MIVQDTTDHFFRDDEIFRFIFRHRRSSGERRTRRSVEKLIDQILVGSKEEQTRWMSLKKNSVVNALSHRRARTSVRFSSRLEPAKSKSAIPSLSVFNRSM